MEKIKKCWIYWIILSGI